MAIGIIISFIISGIIVTLLKHYFNDPRPAWYFQNKDMVKGVYWIPLRIKYSFPSGHSTSAFSTAVIMALYSFNKKIHAFIYLMLACLIAYSRVYLGEHFVEDIWIGSLIGVTTGTIYFIIYSEIIGKNKKKDSEIHLNEPLIKK